MADLKLPTDLTISDRGIAEIFGHEGICLAPYKDSKGIWTVGIGHTAAAGPPAPASMPRGVEMTMAAAVALFRQDIAGVVDRVRQAVKVPISQTEFDALVSFDFNTGGISKAILTQRLNAGDRAGAAAGFDGWHSPPEIIGRRNKEKLLFASGVYSNGGKAAVIPVSTGGVPLYGKSHVVDVLALIGAAPASTPAPSPPVPPATSPPKVEAARPAPRGWLAQLLTAILSFFKGAK